ncbi:hypothetical protein GCM10008941_10600 [Rhizomicrobium palustre]
MPPLHAPESVTVTAEGQGWRWSDVEGREFHVSAEGTGLHLIISGKPGTSLSWAMPQVASGTWSIPDGEGMAYQVNDPFWQNVYHRRRCLGGTTLLSFPAWSHISETHALTYALDDGFQSKLCLQNKDGLQAELVHDFADGAETIDLHVDIGKPNPLAPALFYRRLLKEHGQFKSFADKAVTNLPRLFGAPHAYVWGDGRDLAFLDDLKKLGIERIVLSYDQDPHSDKHLVGPAYLKKAYTEGYLAGPYDAFENGQPAKTADSPAAIWPDDLYPSGCLHDAQGKLVPGFANRGCEMSSEAIAQRTPFVPAERYRDHRAEGASQVFIDVDAFGDFYNDFTPGHLMTKAKDRAHRLARLDLALSRFDLLQGSENVTAWSAPVAHYSHGTAQAHVMAIWEKPKANRFGGYWPPERQAIYFAPYTPTPDEVRLLFGAADRLPLFEAAFHDSVVALDRWEFGLMKMRGLERQRFARALLYGTPTIWNLDRRELARVGTWLKAAQDDFRSIHGTDVPVALTGFAWLTPDQSVQQTKFADGRSITANFGSESWNDLGPDCVRVVRPNKQPSDVCPPADPAPFKQ